MTDVERVILITGAARGIGCTIAEQLAGPGTALVLTDLDDEALVQAEHAVRERGAPCSTLRVDVTVAIDANRMVQHCVQHFGRIDAFFNNAGMIEVEPFLQATEAVWDRTMDVNAKGVFLCGQAVAKHMVERRAGRIVNTASVAARVGVADMLAYAASKAAVMSITRSMALAVAKYGVTVNALAPGIVATDMWDKIDEQRGEQLSLSKGEAMAERVAAIPLGRAATPADVAKVAQFLISDAAAYVTGQTLNIDGGMRLD